MKTVTAMLALLAAAHCCQVHANEPELQITPRLGFGSIELDPGVLTVDNSDVDADNEVDTIDAGVGVAYLTPFGLMLEAGVQAQTNTLFGGLFDEVTFSEQYLAVGFQFELGNGFRLTPKIGRTRWELRNEEGIFLNPGPEEVEEIDGYEDFYEVSFTKTISRSVSMGVRYKWADYSFGEVESVMFVTTFGIR
jgi:hypothetical protein